MFLTVSATKSCTENEKITCTFYLKVGVCRNGNNCRRLHLKPEISKTLLLRHFYVPPCGGEASDASEHYEHFYEDVLNELSKFGEVEKFVVCDNAAFHMVMYSTKQKNQKFGNVFVKFATERQAEKALFNLHGRYYAGQIVKAEYSPVTNFEDVSCRQFDEYTCNRGGYCSFVHWKPVPLFAHKYFRQTKRRATLRYSLKYLDY
ncbi:U2 snrnp auxiliary factor, small subunit [Reticulomyxa filosa]|uniref:U2 snrnp auxiliary factor, small subunit n=1 Tax=Reticulomyxa filosa TaxID=46433 RepID=X6MZX0_RETFI|nr:U2 snrnp auxiliary factor, small subunit [Reticulomyxa filosa]|eukprot:ETO19575.1 U2 snrnp auxiliary factor, small subunit [Reticulomyxa filosa]